MSTSVFSAELDGPGQTGLQVSRASACAGSAGASPAGLVGGHGMARSGKNEVVGLVAGLRK